MQPAYQHLDNAANYPNANFVLDRVFFIRAAPHYHEKIFNIVEDLLQQHAKKMFDKGSAVMLGTHEVLV